MSKRAGPSLAWWWTVALAVAAAVVVSPALAQECRGTKQFYQGQCRYPDEIAKLKAAKAAAAADARRRAEEEKRKAEEEKRKAEEEKRRAEEAANQPEPAPTAAPEPAPVEPSPEPADPEPAPTATPAVDPAPAAPTSSPAEVEDESGISPLVWVGFGVAAAGTIVGGITGGISLSQASDLKDQCPNDVCPPDKQGDVDGMMTLGHVSTVSFVLAGVGAVVGIVGLLLPGGDESPEEGDVALQPVIGPGVLGLRGAF